MKSVTTDPAQAVVARPFDALLEFLGAGLNTLLDIGCGTGALSDELAQQGYSVTALDPQIGEGVLASRVRGSAHALPLADDTFDCTLLHWSLHHVPQDSMDRALDEACRVLRKGGTLCVVEPEPVGSWQVVTQDFHDETEVQALAIQALERTLLRQPHTRRRGYYLSEDRYPDFKAFVTDMMSLAYNRYSRDDICHPRVVRAFESCAARGEYVLHQRIRMESFSMIPKAVGVSNDDR